MNTAMMAPTTHPLDQLHDIRLPDPVSAWPPGPGWWLLALLCLLLISGLVWFAIRVIRPRLWRYQAARKLPPVSVDTRYFTLLNAWFKDRAHSYYPEAATGPLSGDAWVDFLHERAPDLSREALARITQSALTPQPLIDPEGADRIAREWLRRQPC